MSQALADAYLCLVVSLQPWCLLNIACGIPGSLQLVSLMCLVSLAYRIPAVSGGLVCLVSVSLPLVHLVPMVPGTPLVVYLVPVVSAKKHLTMHVLHYKNE